MQQQEIEIKIDSDGKVSFYVKGMKGKGCTALTEAIEKTLGEIESRTFTSEYYQSENVAIREKIAVGN